MSSVEARLAQTSRAISDAGGVAARQGFKYQDHVAAQFVLRMIAEPRLLRIECETSDDILLVWIEADSITERPEYVQVKTTDGDSKWSQAEICKREDPKKTDPTSLIEKSLLCDCNGPNALFRIVSRRDVNKTLLPLKIERNLRTGNSVIIELSEKIGSKYKTTSSNGNDLAHWALNAFWQVTSDVDALVARNQQMLSILAEQYGTNPTHSHVCKIYKEILDLVDQAATASRVTAPEQKIIDRISIMKWWSSHLAMTEAASRRTSKPYRTFTEGFFTQLHHLTEKDIQRAMTGYDARYERHSWRSAQLAEYLADWLPEIALKASELVEVSHLNMRQKVKTAIREIERHREVDLDRLLAEMLLHAVLRHMFQSEPIACKLFFQSAGATKTFGNAHIIHGERDELWLGRAILVAASTYDAVLTSIMKELDEVLDPDFIKQEREVILTLREPQHMLPTTLEEALRRNTPIDDLLAVLCIPILIAYDSNVLGTGFTEDYRDRLVREVNARYEAIKPLLPSSIEKVNVHIFFVPVECVATLAEQFAERLKGQ